MYVSKVCRIEALAALIVLIVLAGCGVGTTNASDENTSPPTNSGGPVSIATDHSRYAATEGIRVTVVNHQSDAIFAFDTRASCSILNLQVLVAGQWQASPAAPCALGRVAVSVKIEPGASYVANIRAGISDKRQGTFPAGTYRLELAYNASAGTADGSSVVYSEQFVITAGSQATSSAPSAPAPGGTGPAQP